MKQFVVKGVSLKDHMTYKKSGEEYQDDILKDDSPLDRGISNNISKALLHVQDNYWLLSQK